MINEAWLLQDEPGAMYGVGSNRMVVRRSCAGEAAGEKAILEKLDYTGAVKYIGE